MAFPSPGLPLYYLDIGVVLDRGDRSIALNTSIAFLEVLHGFFLEFLIATCETFRVVAVESLDQNPRHAMRDVFVVEMKKEQPLIIRSPGGFSD